MLDMEHAGAAVAVANWSDAHGDILHPDAENILRVHTINMGPMELPRDFTPLRVFSLGFGRSVKYAHQE